MQNKDKLKSRQNKKELKLKKKLGRLQADRERARNGSNSGRTSRTRKH